MRRWWVPPVLLLLAVGFFWRLLIAPDGFIYRPNSPYSDLTITHWPNALFIRRSLTEWGQVPLWRPLILGGEPFAANPLSGLWYPPYWLLLVLPLTPAFNLLFVLHTAWAGWGGYRLARATGASTAGGMLAALVLMFAPKGVAHLAAGHVGLYCAWTWLPWLLWSVRRLAERAGPEDAATAAATAAMLILADVRLGFYGGIAAAGYWVMKWGSGHKGCPYVATGMAAGVLAAALVAVQVVPLAAVAGRLNRGGLSLEESGIASLPPRYLVGLLVADHGGFQEWMTYVGAVGLLLAGVGLARWRGRERWWWAGLAVVAAVYSLGTHTPLYSLLYRVLPPLAWLRGPARAWFLVVAAVGVLAAQGLTAMERGTGQRNRPPGWIGPTAAGLAAAAAAGGVGGLAFHLPANVVAAAVVWPVEGMLLLLRAGRVLRRSAFIGLMLPLTMADLWSVGFTLYRIRPAEEVLAEGRAAASWLAIQPGPFRVYSPSYAIPQQTGAVYGIETVDGVDPFQLADYVAFMRTATRIDLPGYSVTVPSFPEGLSPEEMLLAHRGIVPDLKLLGLLNVRYLAAAYPMEAEGLTELGEWEGAYLYRNDLALPRAFVVGRVEEVGGLEEALARLVEVDPGKVAVVGRGIGGRGDAGTRRHGREEVRIVGWSPNRIEVEAEGPGLLVLSEVYDPDWRVRVDGTPTEAVRTDGILRGVYLREGRHRVEFSYWPAGLTAGGVITALGWGGTAALWIIGRRWRTGGQPIRDGLGGRR